jgi:ABC-type transport system substrate-binding protein
MFDHQVARDHITVIKSPYYYDKYTAHFDKIVFKPTPDPSAAMAALEAGDIQVLSGFDQVQIPALQGTRAST